MPRARGGQELQPQFTSVSLPPLLLDIDNMRAAEGGMKILPNNFN